MGLDTTHDCWHGAYSAFMRWRQKLAEVAGLPPLMLMDGFFRKGDVYDPFTDLARQYPESANQYYRSLPIRWESLKEDPYFYELLDSEGLNKLIEYAGGLKENAYLSNVQVKRLLMIKK